MPPYCSNEGELNYIFSFSVPAQRYASVTGGEAALSLARFVHICWAGPVLAGPVNRLLAASSRQLS